MKQNMQYNEKLEQYKLETNNVKYIIYAEDYKELAKAKNSDSLEKQIEQLEKGFISNKDRIYQMVYEELSKDYEEITKDNIEKVLGKPIYILEVDELVFSNSLSDGHTVSMYIYDYFEDNEQVMING